jgi:hypothetical protein
LEVVMAGHLTAIDHLLDHQFHQSNDHSRRASRILPHGEFSVPIQSTMDIAI